MLMHFKTNGDWKEIEVRVIREFKWEGMSFILHKNIIDYPPYRVSHKGSGMFIWEGDSPTETMYEAVSFMDKATVNGIANFALRELGV